MAFHQEVQENFDQVVPAASRHGDTFLATIQKRTASGGIGISLDPIKASRKSDRIVLRGSITFGSIWNGKEPYTLEVYADALGQALQVGWQLTTQEIGGMLANTNMGQYAAAGKARRQADPNIMRQVSGILQAFHQTIFLPTLQDLINAVQRSQQQSAGGFFSA